MKDRNSNIYNVILTIGFVLIIVFGLALGYLSADLYDKYNESKDLSEAKKLTAQEVSTEEIKLKQNASIIYNRVYTKCDEVDTQQSVADNIYVGKNERELKEIFSDWNIMEFSSDKLVLQKSIDSYSPKYYKIGTYENEDGFKMVAVYTYDIEGSEVLKNVTDTPVELLHDNEVEKLEAGIHAEGEEELYELLENYDE